MFATLYGCILLFLSERDITIYRIVLYMMLSIASSEAFVSILSVYGEPDAYALDRNMSAVAQIKDVIKEACTSVTFCRDNINWVFY